MPDLRFLVQSAAALPHAAAPTLAFSLQVENVIPEETIHSIALRCQLQLEVTRRNYTDAEKSALRDLFGEPGRWSQTLRPMLWTHVSAVVPQFTGRISIELQTPCTFDFNVAATKYLYGLEDGEIPVSFLFSGTVYYQTGSGMLNVVPVPWDKEARFRLPVKVWREMMDMYYPNSAWLCLRRDVFERLLKYKVDQGIPTWEAVIERILDPREEVVRS